MKREIFIMAIVIVLLSQVVLSIPQQINGQGQILSSNGSAIVGNFYSNFTINCSGLETYQDTQLITTNSNGVFNFIILDEIFGSQDMFRRQNIMKALNGLSSKFRQIFLITHIEDVKDDMENIIFVNEMKKGLVQ